MCATPEFTVCPNRGCGRVAVVTDRFVIECGGLPVEHVRTVCSHRERHTLRIPVAMTAGQAPALVDLPPL